MADVEILGIQFQEEGMVISFIGDDDVRVGGRSIMQRTISLSVKHPDYADDMVALHHKAVKVLKNALDDFDSSEPYVPDLGDDDDDDEKGMGEE